MRDGARLVNAARGRAGRRGGPRGGDPLRASSQAPRSTSSRRSRTKGRCSSSTRSSRRRTSQHRPTRRRTAPASSSPSRWSLRSTAGSSRTRSTSRSSTRPISRCSARSSRSTAKLGRLAVELAGGPPRQDRGRGPRSALRARHAAAHRGRAERRLPGTGRPAGQLRERAADRARARDRRRRGAVRRRRATTRTSSRCGSRTAVRRSLSRGRRSAPSRGSSSPARSASASTSSWRRTWSSSATTIVPGVIGRVGTMFGEAGVNIANMAVSRTKEGGQGADGVLDRLPLPAGARRQAARRRLRRPRLISWSRARSSRLTIAHGRLACTSAPSWPPTCSTLVWASWHERVRLPRAPAIVVAARRRGARLVCALAHELCTGVADLVALSAIRSLTSRNSTRLRDPGRRVSLARTWKRRQVTLAMVAEWPVRSNASPPSSGCGSRARLEEFGTGTPTAAGGGRLRARGSSSRSSRLRRSRSWRSSRATDAATSRRSAAQSAPPARPRRQRPTRSRRRPASPQGPSHPSRSLGRPRSDRADAARALGRLGRAPAPDATSSASAPASSSGWRAQRRWTSSRSLNTIRSRTRTGRSPEQMQETEKIWMNGELVDWADAKVHVGVHGLHYGTGVFEGIRCYDTPNGPAVFRLADHLQRLHDSARLLYMELPFTVDGAARSYARDVRRQRSPVVLHPPDRVLWLRRARRLDRGQPGRDRDHELAVGRVPRRGGSRQRHPAKISSWKRVGANIDPARLEGDRHLPQLDARDDRGTAGRLRRGDPAHRRRLRRRRPGREHLHRSRTASSARRRSRRRSCPGSRATR